MNEILVVGSLAYDSIQTPSGKVDRALGGSANYFSLAATLFAQVRVVGVVGEDYSANDREMLQKRQVDLAGLQVQPGKTFHWEGKYEGDLNEAQPLKTELNVFEKFDPQIPKHFSIQNLSSWRIFLQIFRVKFWINVHLLGCRRWIR